MKNKLLYFALIVFLYLAISKPVSAQNLKACEIVTVQDINKVLLTGLQYDPNSIINKSGKFECRFTDSKLSYSTYSNLITLLFPFERIRLGNKIEVISVLFLQRLNKAGKMLLIEKLF